MHYPRCTFIKNISYRTLKSKWKAIHYRYWRKKIKRFQTRCRGSFLGPFGCRQSQAFQNLTRSKRKWTLENMQLNKDTYTSEESLATTTRVLHFFEGLALAEHNKYQKVVIWKDTPRCRRQQLRIYQTTNREVHKLATKQGDDAARLKVQVSARKSSWHWTL